MYLHLAFVNYVPVVSESFVSNVRFIIINLGHVNKLRQRRKERIETYHLFVE